MRFRQIHLDFHTSPLITGIGEKFDKEHWQKTLKDAEVDSITCFSCCHHGYSYHPTKIGKMHPELKFNLLRAQIDACHEIGIKVPIYLTAGINQYACEKNPGWRSIDSTGRYASWNDSPLKPGYFKICFNADGYIDYLCDLIEESVTMFPDADGVFLDIISQTECCCPACIRDMLANGLDPEKSLDRRKMARRVMLNYYRRTFEAVRKHSDTMTIFHNAGHITMGDTEILPYFSHLELESLPTGGWGYDHYPMSAAYSRKLGLEFLGMTGKFHTTWGEFGGFKHPNALRYECAAMLANSSKCSIGDQLHPCGKLDESTYKIIGAAYKEVKVKEPWCDNVTSPADIAILGAEPHMNEEDKIAGNSYPDSSIGASRLMLELHQFFDFVTLDMDLSQYKVLIIPDIIRLTESEFKIVKSFIDRGGKIVLSGDSGFSKNENKFLFDIDAEVGEKSSCDPDYLLPADEFAPEYLHTPMVMYASSRRVTPNKNWSRATGKIYDSYFNRTFAHFSSHLHTPNEPEESGYASGMLNGNILYFSHPIFTLYRKFGNVAVKEHFAKAFFTLLGKDRKFTCDLPSQGRATLQYQKEHNREILHLLFATPALRGGGSVQAIEVIEDLNPCPEVNVSLKCEQEVKGVKVVPENKVLSFTFNDGTLCFTAPEFTCHQMIEIQY